VHNLVGYWLEWVLFISMHCGISQVSHERTAIDARLYEHAHITQNGHMLILPVTYKPTMLYGLLYIFRCREITNVKGCVEHGHWKTCSRRYAAS